MMPKRNALLIAALALTISLACSFTALIPAGTATPDYPATQALETSTAAAAAAATAAGKATAAVEATAAKKATTEAKATQAYLDGQATQAALETMNASRKSTKQAGTEVAYVTATAQAQTMALQVQDLYENGIITSTEGIYYQLPDFNESWAQINWYRWWRQGLILNHFVVRTNVEWESASNIANWFDSGCGFIFAKNGEEDYYGSFLALDGHVHTFRVKNNIGAEIDSGYYGRLDTPGGKAELMLAVDDYYMTFFVNGRKVARSYDRNLGEGMFGMTLHSGTNKDYGTRCQMKNIEVWELE